MAHWKRICCPVDFSAVSALAAEEAVELASYFGADVFLLHVREAVPAPALDETLAGPEALQQARFEDERQLAAWQERSRRVSGVRVESALAAGDPAAEILRYADRARCDVIVMGTHGRSGREGVAFGSVAQRVVLDAPCQVLVVHPRRAAPAGRSAAG